MVKTGNRSRDHVPELQIRVKEQIGQDPWMSFSALAAVYLTGTAELQGPDDAPTKSKPAGPTPQSARVKLCEKATATQKTKDGRDEKKDLNICLTHHERLDGDSGMVLVSAAVRQVEGQDKQAFLVSA